MIRHSSLLWHYTYGAVFTAVCAFAGLIGLVAYQLEGSMARQETELLNLSHARLLETLSADVKLAGTRLEFLFQDRLRRVNAISERVDTAKAVESRNNVAMSELLGPAAKLADVDSLIVLDEKGRVIGASAYSADLVTLNDRIQKFGFFGEIAASLKSSYPGEKLTFSAVLPRDDTSIFVPGDTVNAVSQVIFVPVFDDFGYVIGGLLAQRWLRTEEPLLADLAEINSFELAVVFDNMVISRANFSGSLADLETSPTAPNITYNGARIIECGVPVSPMTVCALLPIEELTATQAELTRIGTEEEQKLLRWLFLFGLLALVAFAAVAFLLSRQITRPLTKITRVLTGIAAGDFESQVAGTERMDEVGDIARSVVSLQRSVKERDALRNRVHEKNTILRSQEAQLREQNILFDAALNNMSHGLCMFDREGRLIVSNQRFAELFECRSGRVKPGMTATQVVAAQQSETLEPEETTRKDARNAEHRTPSGAQSTKLEKTRSGRIVLTTRQPLADGGWVAISEDVTERQEARDRLAFLARHDLLTQLPNRIEFREQLDLLLRRQKDEGGEFAILCLDLDEFKTVNDSLGHPIGDELLRQVADRLRDLCGERDLVVRLGGDEFAILTKLPVKTNEVEDLAELITWELSQPFHIADHEIVIGVSIGISVARADGIVGDELFKQADLALYRAKEDGRNTHRFFQADMGTAVNDRRELITDLRSAVANNELELFFQPQYALDDFRISGFEALVRWNHPRRGMVPPGDFIPIAEDTGLILQVGEWVLNEACRIAAGWPEDLRVAVNLSPRQLRGHAFGPVLVKALSDSGLRADRLELEVTETVLLTDSEEVLEALHQAKSLGVKVSMDDFGTGYSSLSYLRRFPFDKIKIDQSFVRSMAYSEDSISIVKAVIELAKNLDMTTTAEGVETRELLDMLTEIGCTDAQGYYLGRPMPLERVEELICNSQSSLTAAAQ
ncbi:bifunctional diguanylate cyclase/phosphodiesterase [Roseibium sediminicola]|uniref:EAL domain-containing protein n=1 Tax=Roseibium sediminicola TaxID=2933272 RepID=A0ABT0GXW3_9HYPH|nr:EAL domain-containing protein [Roseibium sp. CAU 1639]MCK7613902.1 EAL domain-containing protein [Roseibium sp. CAU 1639]